MATARGVGEARAGTPVEALRTSRYEVVVARASAGGVESSAYGVHLRHGQAGGRGGAAAGGYEGAGEPQPGRLREPAPDRADPAYVTREPNLADRDEPGRAGQVGPRAGQR